MPLPAPTLISPPRPLPALHPHTLALLFPLLFLSINLVPFGPKSLLFLRSLLAANSQMPGSSVASSFPNPQPSALLAESVPPLLLFAYLGL